MYFLLENVDFHCHVGLPVCLLEGNYIILQVLM